MYPHEKDTVVSDIDLCNSVRGYQFKSEGPGESKKNKAAFTMLDEGKEVLAESVLPPASADARELEQQGFAERTSSV
jgi:queuine tRNA-ribosyltransferase accessory subunit